jgi:hypothetical protein
MSQNDETIRVAYLVGGPRDGDLLAIRPGMRVLQAAEAPEINWLLDSWEDIIDVNFRIVDYTPATADGFLWYART